MPEREAILISYRVIGGPAGVDQRLTLHEDGLVYLDERHRKRGRTTITLGEAHVLRIRGAIERVPASRWSLLSRLTVAQGRRGLRRLLGIWPDMDLGTTFFELRRGRRRICGDTDRETDVEEVRVLLDSLRAHAVEAAERDNPTGGS